MDAVLDARGVQLPDECRPLLSLIAKHTAVSRSDLETLSSTSRTTLVQRLGSLFAADLIRETEEKQATGG